MTTSDHLDLQVRLKAAVREARRAEAQNNERRVHAAHAALYRLRFEISIALRRPLSFS